MIEVANPVEFLHNFLPTDGSARLVKYTNFTAHLLNSIEAHTEVEIGYASSDYEKLLELLVSEGLIELEYEKPDRLFVKRGYKLKYG